MKSCDLSEKEMLKGFPVVERRFEDARYKAETKGLGALSRNISVGLVIHTLVYALFEPRA